MDLDGSLIAVIVPLAALSVALMAYALVDLLRRDSAAVNGPKWLWAALIVFVNPLGSVAYLLAGRRET